MKKKNLKTGLHRLASRSRQMLVEPEFRIRRGRPEPDFAAAADAFAKRMARPAPPPAPEPRPAPHSRSEDRALIRFIAEIATGVWRLRRRMIDPATKRPLEVFRREYRHVEALWDVLAQAGVEIKDFDGERFDLGLELRALSYVPKAGISREIVEETIKPAVSFQSRPIQEGEVIVATPAGAAAEPGPAAGTPPPPAP